MGRLKGKKAVVTAAGQGIGAAIAEAFNDEGATVYASDLKVPATHDQTRYEMAALDVTDPQAIYDYAARTGKVDILVNVAGFVHHGSILDCDDDDWEFSFNLNVKSMHHMSKAFLPGMLGTGAGSIINMSSGASSLKGVPNRYVYGTTKAAVIGLTKSIAADYVGKGVRANAICPGTVQSPSWEERVSALGKELGSTEEAMKQFVSRQPMGRVGRPEEIASLAVYLASDESAFVTGTAIPIDGGWTL